jgi:sulfur carrier protein
MTITLNGAPHRVQPGTAIADLLPAERRGTAVALNGAVVPRAEHETTRIADGDVVEIVTAVQGG